jgi:hypothetical protein
LAIDLERRKRCLDRQSSRLGAKSARFAIPRPLQMLGWIATFVMAVTVLAMVVT